MDFGRRVRFQTTLLFMCCGLLVAKEPVEIASFKYTSFPVGVGYQNDCLMDRYHAGGKSHLKIFTQMPSTNLACRINQLNEKIEILIYRDLSEFTDTLIDSITNNVTVQIILHTEYGFPYNHGHIVNLVISGAKEGMNYFLNGKPLLLCNNELEYKLYKCDTINKKDQLGMRQGVWLDFNENGQIAALDSFYNDKRLVRYYFDESGNTSSRIDQYGNAWVKLKNDTSSMIFRHFPRVPTFDNCNELNLQN